MNKTRIIILHEKEIIKKVIHLLENLTKTELIELVKTLQKENEELKEKIYGKINKQEAPIVKEPNKISPEQKVKKKQMKIIEQE